MELNVTTKERISNGFLKVDRLTIELPDGKKIVREVVRKRNVVAILAVTEDGKVFLTKQPRAGVNVMESIEIPAGLIEENEEPSKAARRELEEETGCVLTEPLISLGSYTFDPACSTSVTHLFLALNVKKEKKLHLDDDEYLECFTKPIDEVYEMLENGVIRDGNSVVSLLKSKKYFRKKA